MARSSKTNNNATPTEIHVQVLSITPLMTIPEVARTLHLSRVQVYRLINRGKLPTVKIQGARRVRPADLQSWIEHLTA